MSGTYDVHGILADFPDSRHTPGLYSFDSEAGQELTSFITNLTMREIRTNRDHFSLYTIFKLTPKAVLH